MRRRSRKTWVFGFACIAIVLVLIAVIAVIANDSDDVPVAQPAALAPQAIGEAPSLSVGSEPPAEALAGAGSADEAIVGQGTGALGEPNQIVDRVRVFDELENVENTIFALDSVWAVTSNLADNFSRGETNATVVRIDPATGETETVLGGLSTQPTFASLNQRVWAKLEDRIVAFDAAGSEVASLPWAERGDMVAGERYLWVADFGAAQVVAIDALTAQVVGTVETGKFPVAPLIAFGHVWIPSSTDGTVTIIDEATLGDTTHLSLHVTSRQQTDVTAVPGGAEGNEVWVTNVDGELFAIGAELATLGQLRDIPVDRPINQIVVQRDRVVLLPTWGVSVLVADLASGEILAQLAIDSIPVRAVTVGDQVWVASDGHLETLTRIDPQSLAVVEQFQVGSNNSNTTGPTQPFVVGQEVWVPNRGDNAIFAVST